MRNQFLKIFCFFIACVLVSVSKVSACEMTEDIVSKSELSRVAVFFPEGVREMPIMFQGIEADAIPSEPVAISAKLGGQKRFNEIKQTWESLGAREFNGIVLDTSTLASATLFRLNLREQRLLHPFGQESIMRQENAPPLCFFLGDIHSGYGYQWFAEYVVSLIDEKTSEVIPFKDEQENAMLVLKYQLSQQIPMFFLSEDGVVTVRPTRTVEFYILSDGRMMLCPTESLI